MTDYAKVMLGALREASTLCQNVQQSLDFGVLRKGDRSPVTVADFGSQALICHRIKEAFPNDPIVAEEDAAVLRQADQRTVAQETVRRVQETGHQVSGGEVLARIDYGNGQPNSERFWTLDPIDGTKGFLRGEQYAIALALIENGTVQMGALGCPNLEGGLMLFAERGNGSWSVPLDGSTEFNKISVSSTSEPSEGRFCESVVSGHSSHGDASRVAERLGITKESLRIDSQAKYAVVARGAADIYLRFPTRKDYQEKIWDHAAGSLVLSEAGGTVTDIFGRSLDFSLGRTLAHNKGVVATNGHLHDRLLAAINALNIGRNST